VSAGNRRLSILALVVVLAAPVIAYQTMPSLQQRIGYMRYDWEKYRQNQGGTYSDAQRWVSLEIGVRLWMRDPLLGIGAGDLPIEVQMMANDHYPSYSLDPRLPHNQFIYILCGTGLLGLCLSLIALFAPLTVRAARRFYLFAVFQIMMFVSFLVEYTLETAIGVAFYLFFTLWFMQLGQALAVEKTAKSS
jgi:O-antigen ligase